MSQTERQKAANAALEGAVTEALEAYGLGGGVLGDLMVLVTQTQFTSGEQITNLTYLAPGQPPHYRLLGLLDFARLQLSSFITRDNLT